MSLCYSHCYDCTDLVDGEGLYKQWSVTAAVYDWTQASYQTHTPYCTHHTRPDPTCLSDS